MVLTRSGLDKVKIPKSNPYMRIATSKGKVAEQEQRVITRKRTVKVKEIAKANGQLSNITFSGRKDNLGREFVRIRPLKPIDYNRIYKGSVVVIR